MTVTETTTGTLDAPGIMLRVRTVVGDPPAGHISLGVCQGQECDRWGRGRPYSS